MPEQDEVHDWTGPVLDHYEDPYHHGSCPEATHRLQRESPLCGDWVSVDLVISADDRIEQAWFDGQGCVLSQAAASMLMEAIEGLSRQQVREFSAAQMLALIAAPIPPSRQKCCLLPWRVVQGAIDSPLADDAYDGHSDGPRFGGPSLGEEA